MIRFERMLLRAAYPLVRRMSLRAARFAVGGFGELPGHEWSADVLSAPYATADVTAPPIPRSTLERIVRSYQRSDASNPYAAGSMWADFRDRNRAAHEALMKADVSGLEEELGNPASSDLHYGFDEMYKEWITTLRHSEQHRVGYAAYCSAALLRLAESMGLVRRFNPEASHLNVLPKISVEDVLATLDRRLGYRVGLPNIYPGEPGIATSRGILNSRAISSLYLVDRVRTILGELRGKRIVEFGPGLGRSVFFAAPAGPACYHVVDLPFTALSQGHFLCQTLGADNVLLQRETSGGAHAAPAVKLFAPDEFLDSHERYDIAVTFDCFTEMTETQAAAYWHAIRQRCGAFLSVNHEANRILVRSLVDPAREDSMVLRYPHWLRNGYVEELVLSRR